MSVEVTCRHLEFSDGIRTYARERGEELAAEFPRVEHVHIILDGQKHHRVAEVVVQGKSHIRVESMERAEKTAVALDAAFEKVSRQLRKARDKVQDHKGAIDMASFERAQSRQ